MRFLISEKILYYCILKSIFAFFNKNYSIDDSKKKFVNFINYSTFTIQMKKRSYS